MTERESEAPDAGSHAPRPEDARTLEVADEVERTEERRFLTYEGAAVPRFLAVLWIAFLVFAVVYFVRHVPGSMMEWFR